jgi:CheY-like chemotaxis protein
MMSGSIWFESEPGKGSTFKFTFKARRSSGRNEENSKNTTTWSGLSFMFVDDDPVILEYAEEIMRRFGVSCDTASSGEEALERVKQNGGYNVYFVDWKMPGMDGIALTRALKAIKSDKGNTVIIMISSVDMELIEGEAKKAGADKFLMKPLFPSAIVNAINEALGNAYDTTVADQDDLSRLFMGYRILLAEDMEINREIVMALFESTQVEIDCVENGEEAVRAFSASPEKYNMIFMDVQMPVMDGYEATLAIRSLDNPSAKTIPIVAMTADVFQEDIQKARASGMNAHIGKPLDFNEIWEVMKTLLLGSKD